MCDVGVRMTEEDRRSTLGSGKGLERPKDTRLVEDKEKQPR